MPPSRGQPKAASGQKESGGGEAALQQAGQAANAKVISDRHIAAAKHAEVRVVEINKRERIKFVPATHIAQVCSSVEFTQKKFPADEPTASIINLSAVGPLLQDLVEVAETHSVFLEVVCLRPASRSRGDEAMEEWTRMLCQSKADLVAAGLNKRGVPKVQLVASVEDAPREAFKIRLVLGDLQEHAKEKLKENIQNIVGRGNLQMEWDTLSFIVTDGFKYKPRQYSKKQVDSAVAEFENVDRAASVIDDVFDIYQLFCVQLEVVRPFKIFHGRLASDNDSKWARELAENRAQCFADALQSAAGGKHRYRVTSRIEMREGKGGDMYVRFHFGVQEDLIDTARLVASGVFLHEKETMFALLYPDKLEYYIGEDVTLVNVLTMRVTDFTSFNGLEVLGNGFRIHPALTDKLTFEARSGEDSEGFNTALLETLRAAKSSMMPGIIATADGILYTWADPEAEDIKIVEYTERMKKEFVANYFAGSTKSNRSGRFMDINKSKRIYFDPATGIATVLADMGWVPKKFGRDAARAELNHPGRPADTVQDIKALLGVLAVPAEVIYRFTPKTAILPGQSKNAVPKINPRTGTDAGHQLAGDRAKTFMKALETCVKGAGVASGVDFRSGVEEHTSDGEIVLRSDFGNDAWKEYVRPAIDEINRLGRIQCSLSDDLIIVKASIGFRSSSAELSNPSSCEFVLKDLAAVLEMFTIRAQVFRHFQKHQNEQRNEWLQALTLSEAHLMKSLLQEAGVSKSQLSPSRAMPEEDQNIPPDLFVHFHCGSKAYLDLFEYEPLLADLRSDSAWIDMVVGRQKAVYKAPNHDDSSEDEFDGPAPPRQRFPARFRSALCWGVFSLTLTCRIEALPVRAFVTLHEDRLVACPVEGSAHSRDKPEVSYLSRHFEDVEVFETGLIITMRNDVMLKLEGERTQSCEDMHMILLKWQDALEKVRQLALLDTRVRSLSMASFEQINVGSWPYPQLSTFPPGWDEQTQEKLREIWDLCDKDAAGRMTKAALLDVCNSSPMIAEFFGVKGKTTRSVTEMQVSALDGILHSLEVSALGGITWQEFRNSYVPWVPGLLLQGTVGLKNSGGIASQLHFFRIFTNRLEYITDFGEEHDESCQNFMSIDGQEVKRVRLIHGGFVMFLLQAAGSKALEIEIFADDSMALWQTAFSQLLGYSPAAQSPPPSPPQSPTAAFREVSGGFRPPPRQAGRKRGPVGSGGSQPSTDSQESMKCKPPPWLLEEMATSFLTDWLGALRPHLVHHGVLWLREKVASSFVARYCVLNNDSFNVFDRPMDAAHGLKPNIQVQICQVRGLECFAKGFVLHHRGGNPVAANSGSFSELQRWLEAFFPLVPCVDSAVARHTELLEALRAEQPEQPQNERNGSRQRQPSQALQTPRGRTRQTMPTVPAETKISALPLACRIALVAAPGCIHVSFDPALRRAMLRTDLAFRPHAYRDRADKSQLEFQHPDIARAILAELAMLHRQHGGKLLVIGQFQGSGKGRDAAYREVMLNRAERIALELVALGSSYSSVHAMVQAGRDEMGRFIFQFDAPPSSPKVSAKTQQRGPQGTTP